jgi:riboflavin synthase
MFTGIIEEIGIIKEFSKNNKNALIIIECQKVIESNNIATKIGDSIAIDGVCQTIIALNKKTFSVQVSEETLKVTTFSKFHAGKKVNLERALAIGERFGGHIVSGHADGMAKLKNIQQKGQFYDLKFEVEKDLIPYIVKKGSVSLNGISLTVADIVSNEFSVAVIPHTFKNTNLLNLKSGDFVNIEVDILAKYVENFLSTNNNSNTTIINKDFLKENGFFK